MALKNIWIVTTGTRGDVQPYIAVGVALKKRGYHVEILTSEEFCGFCESFGVKAIAIRESNDRFMKDEDHKIRIGMANGDTQTLMDGITEVNDRSAIVTAKAVKKQVEAGNCPDLVLSGPINRAVAWYLAFEYSIPFYDIACQATLYDPNYMYFGLPTLPFGMHSYFYRKFFLEGSYTMHQAYDRAFNGRFEERFPVQAYSYFYEKPRLPRLILFSPTLAKALYPAACSMQRFVGTTVLTSEQQTGADFGGDLAKQTMEEFIKNGSKPVYLGWGSMLSKSPEYMVEFCARAVFHSGERAVVLGGVAGLTMELLETTDVEEEVLEFAKKNILFVSKAPHEWLFPQMAATVHHGGAGTTTSALRAGVPTIITPVFLDQYDHSHMVNQLQVGFGFRKQLQKIGWRELGDAIRHVASNSTMATNAAKLGETLCREDGPSMAVDEIEAYWKEYCETGKFFDHFPGKFDATPKKSLLGAMFDALALVGTAITAVAHLVI